MQRWRGVGAITDLVGVLEGPSVDTVVRGIELTLWKPSNVTLLETAVLDSLEWDVPVNCLATELEVRELTFWSARAVGASSSIDSTYLAPEFYEVRQTDEEQQNRCIVVSTSSTIFSCPLQADKHR